MQLYADNIQLHLSSRIGLIDDMCYRLHEDLCPINESAINNCLQLNAAKSYVLPISKDKLYLEDIHKLRLGGKNLKLVNNELSLVLIILTVYIVKKKYGSLSSLRLSANSPPTKTNRKLVLQLIVPIITYSEIA